MADAVDAATQRQILQFMTTEHFAQQTARSSTIREANGRASPFLTSVSSATVALADFGIMPNSEHQRLGAGPYPLAEMGAD